MMQDFDALLAEATLPERTVAICLDGRLMGEYEAVKDRIDARGEQPANDVRLGARAPGDPEQDLLDRLLEQIRGKTVPFRLKAMARDQFVELLADKTHEQRKDAKGVADPRDVRLGLNSSTFIPALIRTAVVEPDLSDDARWAKLFAVLSSAQVDKLVNAAWDLNREDREVPFSPSGSPSPQN